MAAPPVFYPAALDLDYWNNHSLNEIRSLWKNSAHRLAGATDVMYAMFYNFENRGWGANWRLYDGPGYPMWYLEHLDVMKNEILSGYRQPKSMLGGCWMDGGGFLPCPDANTYNKMKWATYVSLLKGCTGLNFFGWHAMDWTFYDDHTPHECTYGTPARIYWDNIRFMVDTLANQKNLDELVFTKSNSGPIGHSLTGSTSQNISHSVYKTNNTNWNEYYLLVTNNPNGSLDGPPEANNTINIHTDVNLCYYDVKEVFSNNTVVTYGNHYFNYEFPWFGTALFHVKLKNPPPNNCVEERPIDKSNQEIPDIFYITQNYPNPFNPETEFSFGLPKEEFVTIEIFNSLGQKVSVLLNENKTAGIHTVKFNGNKFASGVYIYKINAGSYTETKKMLLIK